ncbi:hypothetical protein GQ600_7157 [Phytophthora cactorum]|nr:hypothetical protein GQ600_7157 [Phytophthora cactorum]
MDAQRQEELSKVRMYHEVSYRRQTIDELAQKGREHGGRNARYMNGQNEAKTDAGTDFGICYGVGTVLPL